MSLTVTIAFWNRKRNARASPQAEYLRECPIDWDVLILAEVTTRAFREFKSIVQPTTAVHALDLVDVVDMKDPHGIAILGRHGFAVVDGHVGETGGDPALRPRAERMLYARLSSSPELTVAGWHAPYAAGRTALEKQQNPKRKQAAYQQLARWLDQQRGPVALGMDGNNLVRLADNRGGGAHGVPGSRRRVGRRAAVPRSRTCTRP
jgi:hypothetical protein